MLFSVYRVAEVGQRMLAWNVPPSQLVHIPEHWLVYPEPEASIHYLLGLLYMGFFVVACLGNGLVIWVFSTYVHVFVYSVLVYISYSITAQNRYKHHQTYSL